VKLVSYTSPSNDLLEKAGDSLEEIIELIAYCARVSSPNSQASMLNSEKLIEYLVKHKHWSPLEMVDATLEIYTTRDIGRQILRHRSFVFQVFSQRYANPVNTLDFVFREARLQDDSNRQNSISTDNQYLKDEWLNKQNNVMMAAKDAYSWAISAGIAKEQARSVLPEGLTMTKMYMKGSLRSWIHFIEIRSAKETQKEHREVAISCAEVIAEIFPMITRSLSSGSN
jgi:thymidylate synthase (FAD)